MQASIAYVSKFKQSIAFLIHEQAKKSIARRQAKTKLHRDVEFDQENNTIKKRKKMQEFYLKWALANSHFFKLYKILQSLIKEKEVFNNGEMEPCRDGE